eukprot:scaffold13643_cov207-Alexandrium_tamarense.AAC.5
MSSRWISDRSDVNKVESTPCSFAKYSCVPLKWSPFFVLIIEFVVLAAVFALSFFVMKFMMPSRLADIASN